MTLPQSATTDMETTVRALLDAAHLRVSDEEFQLFVRIYPAMRAGADEASVLRVGDAYQQLTDWHLQVPPIATRTLEQVGVR